MKTKIFKNIVKNRTNEKPLIVVSRRKLIAQNPIMDKWGIEKERVLQTDTKSYYDNLMRRKYGRVLVPSNNIHQMYGTWQAGAMLTKRARVMNILFVAVLACLLMAVFIN